MKRSELKTKLYDVAYGKLSAEELFKDIIHNQNEFCSKLRYLAVNAKSSVSHLTYLDTQQHFKQMLCQE